MRAMTEIQGYTVPEFIATFRADGLGHIVVEVGEDVTDISFPEILCDLCNDEITQPEEEPFQKVVFVLDGYALCECCHRRIREEENSSLHFQQLKGGNDG